MSTVIVPAPTATSPTAPGRPVAADSPAHKEVGGVAIFEGGLADAARLCLDWIDSGDGGRVATANLDFLALARKDTHLRQLLGSCHLVVADGAPVAWLARLAGSRRTRRTGGVDLVTALLESSEAREGLRVALYGATPEVGQEARRVIEARHPNARVVAVMSPPFRDRTPLEEAQDCRELQAAAPELVLVALGCPKQEHVISRYYDAIPSALWLGVGGTLDIIAGRRRRAPRLLQRLGLEWFARFAQEPGRLWRRYFLRDLPFFVAVAPRCLWAGLASRLAQRASAVNVRS